LFGSLSPLPATLSLARRAESQEGNIKKSFPKNKTSHNSPYSRKEEYQMSEQNKTIDRRFFEELLNTGDPNVADEIVAPNYVNHNPAPGETTGPEGVKTFATLLRTAFPDGRFTVEDQIAEGDKVVSRFTTTGTHQGEFVGIPATGKRINITGISIHRVTGGQIQEGWLNWDALGMMQQLGAVPGGA
jgi:steroid delta-isomerase-like uncharacterized protein